MSEYSVQSLDKLFNMHQAKQIDNSLFISKLLEFEKLTTDKFERFKICLALGSTYCLDGSNQNLTLSEEYLIKAENDFSIEIIKGNEWQIYFHLGHLYARINSAEKSKEYFEKYILYSVKDGKDKIESDFYSFRNLNKYLFSDLINEEITLSAPETFNDPYDSLIFPFLHYRNNNIIEKSKYDISPMIEAYNPLRIRCFSSIGIKNNQLVFPVFERLMWSHYADEFRGICILYKFMRHQDGISDLLGTKSLTEWFQVEYENNTVFGDITKAKKQLLFATKHSSWTYENEIRLFHYDPTITKEQQHVQIPLKKLGGEIKAIIFGSRCSTKDEQTIRKLFKGKDFFFRIRRVEVLGRNDSVYDLRIDDEEKWKKLNH